jgi:hypothetical protein
LVAYPPGNKSIKQNCYKEGEQKGFASKTCPYNTAQAKQGQSKQSYYNDKV